MFAKFSLLNGASFLVYISQEILTMAINLKKNQLPPILFFVYANSELLHISILLYMLLVNFFFFCYYTFSARLFRARLVKVCFFIGVRGVPVDECSSLTLYGWSLSCEYINVENYPMHTSCIVCTPSGAHLMVHLNGPKKTSTPIVHMPPMFAPIRMDWTIGSTEHPYEWIGRMGPEWRG